MILKGFAESDLYEYGFGEFACIRSLKEPDGCGCIPDKPGVYVVFRRSGEEPEFRREGVCGPHKKKDPNVCDRKLREKWAPGAHVLYFGMAGGSLRTRIGDYVKAGTGAKHSHWGGRYIWQLADCDDLLIAWKPLDVESPHDVEKSLIIKFKDQHGRLPFANLKIG